MIYIFAIPNNQEMKRYKVSQIIRMLENDGWVIKNGEETTGNMLIKGNLEKLH